MSGCDCLAVDLSWCACVKPSLTSGWRPSGPRRPARPGWPSSVLHVANAEGAASIGDTDTGWGQVSRATELQVQGMDTDEIAREATELSVEVSKTDKVNAWRKEAINVLLEPTLHPGSQPATLEQKRGALRKALHVRNESSSNVYRSLTILRRHQFRLLLIAIISITSAIVLIVRGGPDISNAMPNEWWVMSACIALGVTGASTSAAQRSTTMDQGRIPRQAVRIWPRSRGYRSAQSLVCSCGSGHSPGWPRHNIRWRTSCWGPSGPASRSG